MIIGVGIDVVDVARFMETLERTPRLREKLFTPEERELPPASLAARFAAKEAIVHVRDSVAARAAELGVRTWHLSISHDAGIASAMVIAES